MRSSCPHGGSRWAWPSSRESPLERTLWVAAHGDDALHRSFATGDPEATPGRAPHNQDPLVLEVLAKYLRILAIREKTDPLAATHKGNERFRQ
jgi:hypothetical protein